MKAAVLRSVGAPLEVEEVQIDEPGPREVLVRTAAAGVCHSDLSGLNGSLPSELPVVLGHESAGIVEAVGSAVSYVEPGDHVITSPLGFCGQCEFCLSGRPSLCSQEAFARGPDLPPRLAQNGTAVAQFYVGSFAEQLLVHEGAVIKIDETMPLDRAALIGCGITTGLGAVFNTARVAPGSTVAVIGCGGVGLSAIQGAYIAGARRIIAVDRVSSRLERATKLGATDAVSAAEGDPVEQVLELTGGGVEYSFEVVGLKETTEQAFRMLRIGGTAIVVGVIWGKTIELSGTDLQMERSIKGSVMGSNRARIDIPRYVDFYLQGRLKLDELVTARIGLDELNGAFEAMERGEGARSVVVFG